MNRREYLLTGCGLAVLSIAGCTSDGSESGDTGESGDQTNTEESLAPPTLESHDVRPMTGGYEMEVTMTNETEQTLNRAVGEVSVYDGNTRLTDGRAAVIDLESGITSSETALLEQINPDDVTRYTITMSGETEDYEGTGTEEHEFDGEEFRNRLSG